MTARTKTKRRAATRHPFRFKTKDALGKVRIQIQWAKMVPGTREVTLPLTAADVKRSIDARGAGNTQTCAMAVCAQRNQACFPHPVEGYIDWQYTRAYVVSAVNKDGTIKKCVAYRHRDNIARLNDTPGGQRKLLTDLAENGDRLIRLLPYATRRGKTKPGAGEGRRTYTRSSKPAGHGARLRFAMAHGGAAPQEASA
jgi:hypothetical protein